MNDYSVVIPVFNSGSTAIFAIESVLAQTIPCYEIIVIDDGSSDGSADLLRNRFESVRNIVKIFSIQNSGASGARNFGIDKCTTNWIAFLDSDDIWLPHKIERQLHEINLDSKISMIGTLTTMSNFYSYYTGDMPPVKYITLKMLMFKNYFQTSTVFLRRKLIDDFGGFPCSQRYAEEGDFFMRIASKNICALINEVLVDYSNGKGGFGETGLSANLWKMEYGEIKNIYRTFKRGDCGVFLVGLSILFSLAKFFRRILLKMRSNVFKRLKIFKEKT